MSRILVIDDEQEVREALKRRLEREGYEVSLAGSQREGIEAIGEANDSFDVIVTDMLMETTESGIEIIKAAAEKDVFTEVIVLTAYGNVANAVECMRRGAFDYVEKNIPGVDVYELLMMKISQALELSEEAKSTFGRLKRMAREIPSVEQAAKAWARTGHEVPEAGPEVPDSSSSRTEGH